MNDRPLITVVIPTYRRRREVRRAIESVLQQDGSFEVLVVDDGSDDATVESLADWGDPRLRVLGEEHRGRGAARNRGAAEGRGHLITFLDSDDEALPGWLDAWTRSLDSGTGATLLACCGVEILLVDEEGGVVGRRARRPKRLGPEFGSRRALFMAGSWATSRELFLAAGGFDEGLEFGENYELALRLLEEMERRSGVLAVEDELLVRVRHRRWSSPNADAEARWRSAERVLERHGARWRRDAPENYVRYATIAGVNAFRVRRHGKARSHLRAAVSARRLDPRAWARWALSFLPFLARRVWRAGK